MESWWRYSSIHDCRVVRKVKLQPDLFEEYDHIPTYILLDACRYDYFKKGYDLDGKLIKCKSPANHTQKWIEKMRPYLENFTIISGHPYWNYWENVGKEIKHMWKKDKLVNDLNVTTPDPLIKKTIEMKERKTLTHIVQPHLPFIKGKGREFIERVGTGKFTEGGHFSKLMNEEVGKKLTWGEIRKYYTKNLKIPLDIIKEKEEELSPFIITADHGEELGERNRYGHRRDTKEILEIPFFIKED